MFSKIFTFGLAALSLVGAAPATDFQAPIAMSCSVNVQSAGPKASFNAQSDICWRACFPQSPKCPEGWTSRQLGQCYTCCKDDGLHGASAAAYRLEPGLYRIEDVPTHRQLRSYNEGAPIFVSFTRENPGPYGLWQVDEADNGAFTISNLGLHRSVYAADDETIIAGYKGDPVSFAIESAGDNAYVIKSVFEDLVWTLKNPGSVRSEVRLYPANGNDSQKWRFIPANDVSVNAQSDVCLKICAPVPLACAEGWSSRKIGDCFTCCLDE